MPQDDTTTIADCRRVMAGFVAERDWERFHRPKHLAMSIAIEAAELMEHFQWTDERGTLDDAVLTDEQRAEVEDELADVFAYTLSMANAMDIDLSAAFERKMTKNRVKHPPPSG